MNGPLFFTSPEKLKDSVLADRFVVHSSGVRWETTLAYTGPAKTPWAVCVWRGNSFLFHAYFAEYEDAVAFFPGAITAALVVSP